jgi:deoxyribonuclease IV
MIKVGPAGSGGLGHLKGLLKVVEMKLDCMEVQFTYGVRMDRETAEAVGALAKEQGIILSVHAPYYINLASDEKAKIAQSKQRILDSCEKAALLGAGNVVFHAGFYQQKTVSETYRRIKKAILEMQRIISRKGWAVKLCPEITGKPSQFGSLQELLQLSQETGCGITVDFAHLYARQQGAIDYTRLLKQLPQAFHAHFAGIEFGEKGEKRHVVTQRRFFGPLAEALVRSNADVTLINESPQPLKDARMMKRLVMQLQKRMQR